MWGGDKIIKFNLMPHLRQFKLKSLMCVPSYLVTIRERRVTITVSWSEIVYENLRQWKGEGLFMSNRLDFSTLIRGFPVRYFPFLSGLSRVRS